MLDLHRRPPPSGDAAPTRATVCHRLRPGPPLPLPLVLWRVSAGFPSPADDFLEEALDLNDLLVRNPPATFMMRVAGHSMEEARIYDGDLIVVDRSLEARPGDVVIAYLDGALTVKRLGRLLGRPALLPASDAFPPILMTPEMELVVWGVVTHVVHSLR